MDDFTDEQKQYLAGFATGVAARRAALGLPAGLAVGGGASSPNPDAAMFEAQDRTLANGGKLSAEEQAKRKTPPLDRWGALVAAAETNTAPKGVDVFLTKYFGLFHVAPAQDLYVPVAHTSWRARSAPDARPCRSCGEDGRWLFACDDAQ